MNDQPAPREGVDDVLHLDPALRERVRAALRDVPPQDADRAQASIDAALQTLSGRQRRRGAWLAVAAAGVVAVLGVAVLRGPERSDPDSTLDVVAAPMTVEDPAALRLAESALPTTSAIDQFRLDIIDGSPVEDAVCPLIGEERSYGVRPWEDRTVEIMVDVTAGLFRVMDVTTCQVLLMAPLTP
jgi:hypothetical protein